MPKYNYSLINQSGIKTQGTIFATDIEGAREKLNRENKIIISITENKKLGNYFWQRPSLGFEDKMMFTKHMSTMLKVGITIHEALDILISQTKEKNNRKMYENILEMVKSGQTLSKSLKEYDYIFPEIFINMIATGEESGNLEKVLEYLDLQMEKEYEIRKKVVSAFIYPIIILGLTLIITIGIIIFIMPRITKIFSSFNVELPFITNALIEFSDFVVNKPFIALAIVGGSISFITIIFKLKMLKPFWHRIFINLPVFGKILIYSNIARICRTLHSLLQSGVPIIRALDITGNMVSNSLYKSMIHDARDKVEQGAQLGESLEGNEKIFPQMVTKMLYIGEKTGSMEMTTERLAELYEHNVDGITRNLSVLLEPLLLIFMAVMVGGIALAIILPIYQLPNLLHK